MSERTTRIKKAIPVIAVIALVLIAVLAVYAIMVGPSKQPYRSALSQYQNVYNANVAFTNAGAGINAGGASNEEFMKNITMLRSALKNLQTENTALGQTPVLTTGEGKELYMTFNATFERYATYNESVISSIEALRPVLFACSGKMTSITQDAAGAKALRDCAGEMQAVQSIPDKDYEQLAQAFIQSYTGAAEAIERAAATSDEAAQTQATQARDAFVEDLNDATTTLSKNLQAGRAKVVITNAAMALDSFLKKKSSIF